jgi:arginine/lysine/ornithine decarboxylase
MAGADRIESARERLRQALVAGEDTSPHRQALAALEQAAEGEAERQKAVEAEQEETRRRWINARAHQLADEAMADIGTTLDT